MNRNNQILFSVLLMGLVGFSTMAQEKTKTYKETFNVGDETVLNIDTKHADIEFQTWDKSEVEITAIVELKGATDEEAETYFERDAVKIMGNSKEIQVTTSGSDFGVLAPGALSFGDIDIVIPEAPFVEPLFEELEIPELPEVMVIPELPPLPPIPSIDFDYDAYKKDSDKYMKEWQKKFQKNFDGEYQKQLEEWSENIEKMAEERKAEREAMLEEREAMIEEREAMREEVKAAREEARELMREQRKLEREQLQLEREKDRKTRVVSRSIRISNGDDSNIFYYSNDDGEAKEYKVKKSIKIKMPKSVKLKMNVRHGEVKLSANTKNIKASLSHSSLLASIIDGDHTEIRASYSPVVVQQWKYGQLKTDFSDKVDLKEVRELKLDAVSSHVTIDKLMNKVFATSNLGALQINTVSNNFSNIDISVKNGEVGLNVPTVPFTIYVNEAHSELELPDLLTVESTEDYNGKVYKGYHKSKTADKSITINAKYSEVAVKEQG